MELKGKRALVLGATRSIGLAIARILDQHGVCLALPWLDWPESVAAMTEEFGASGKNTKHLIATCDLRQATAVENFFCQLKKTMGGLDILINNIERGGMPILHGAYHRPVNSGQWQLEMETTLHAKWLVFEQAFPLLKAQQEAAVINISSIAGLVGRNGPAGLLFNDAYAAANRGISQLTETWARMGAPNVRVNEIMLGLIEGRHGPGTRGWDALSSEQQRALMQHTLLGRAGKPEEVARAVLFLLRDADYLTGSTLRIDGGYALGGEKAATMPEGYL